MEKSADAAVIYQAYLEYPEYCKAKKGMGLTAKQAEKTKKELYQKVERSLLDWKSSRTTLVEKDALLRRCKLLYDQYCKFRMSSPELVSRQMELKMNTLLEHMADREAEKVSYIRVHEAGGGKLDLEAVFKEKSAVRKLLSYPIDKLLEQALADTSFTIVSREDSAFYITATGKKYHRAQCPYCKGKTLVKTAYAKIQNMKLQPCKCIEKASGAEKRDTRQVLTVFIDESIRKNPWRRWDERIPEKQGSYSYVICKGELQSEEQITRENQISANAGLLNETDDVTFAAMEAISSVLLKIAFGYDFHEDVVIYTDNQAAKDKWHKTNVNRYLAGLFHSVKVCCIPREKNTVADKVGREQAFFNIPSSLMQEIVQKCSRYEAVQKENEFVKEFFPYPEKNIPNLVAELKLLAEEREN